MLFGYVGYYICRKNISAALPLMAVTFNFTNSQSELMAMAGAALLAAVIEKRAHRAHGGLPVSAGAAGRLK